MNTNCGKSFSKQCHLSRIKSHFDEIPSCSEWSKVCFVCNKMSTHHKGINKKQIGSRRQPYNELWAGVSYLLIYLTFYSTEKYLHRASESSFVCSNPSNHHWDSPFTINNILYKNIAEKLLFPRFIIKSSASKTLFPKHWNCDAIIWQKNKTGTNHLRCQPPVLTQLGMSPLSPSKCCCVEPELSYHALVGIQGYRERQGKVGRPKGRSQSCLLEYSHTSSRIFFLSCLIFFFLASFFWTECFLQGHKTSLSPCVLQCHHPFH